MTDGIATHLPIYASTCMSSVDSITIRQNDKHYSEYGYKRLVDYMSTVINQTLLSAGARSGESPVSSVRSSRGEGITPPPCENRRSDFVRATAEFWHYQGKHRWSQIIRNSQPDFGYGTIRTDPHPAQRVSSQWGSTTLKPLSFWNHLS